MAAAKKDLPQLPPDIWTIIIDNVDPPDDFLRFLYMYQNLRAVCRDFKAAVDHIFITQLLPQFETELSIPIVFNEEQPILNGKYELRGIFDRLSTDGVRAAKDCIFRVVQPKHPQMSTPFDFTRDNRTWIQVEVDEENEPSRELKMSFQEGVLNGAMVVYIRGCHYCGPAPPDVDVRRLEIHFDKDTLYRQYFHYARIERQRAADLQARTAEIAASNQSLEGTSMEVENADAAAAAAADTTTITTAAAAAPAPAPAPAPATAAEILAAATAASNAAALAAAESVAEYHAAMALEKRANERRQNRRRR